MRFIRLRIVIHFENVLDFSFWLGSLFRQESGPHSDHWCPLRHTLAEVLDIQNSHNSQSSQSVSLKGWALLDKLSFGEIYGQFVKSLLQHGARRLRGVYVNCELEVHVSVPLREGQRLIRTQVCTWCECFLFKQVVCGWNWNHHSNHFSFLATSHHNTKPLSAIVILK